MATHIKILAWLQIVYGALSLMGAMALFGGTMIGAAYVGSFKESALVGLLGGFASIFLFAIAAFHLIAGWGLLRRMQWARIVTIVLGVISLLKFPIGTALGIYTLWVLLSKDGAAQFGVSSA